MFAHAPLILPCIVLACSPSVWYANGMMTCPECGAPLRSANRNGFCRRHRHLSPVYRETLRKAARACDLRHPDRHREAARRYRERHPERQRESTYQWREKNPDAMPALMRRLRKEHPEVYRAIGKRGHARRRARKLAAVGVFSRLDLRAKGDYQGWRCYWCGIDIRHSWVIDHKIPLSRGGSNWPANLALACHSCNCKKNNANWRKWWPRHARSTHAPPCLP